MPSIAFNVYLGSRVIDTVFYDRNMTTDDVKRSLINHDGYDNNIRVTKPHRRNLKPKVAGPVLTAASGPAPRVNLGCSPVPHYDPKEWDSYEQFLVHNNID